MNLDLANVPRSPVTLPSYDPEYDDVRSIILDLCECISNRGHGIFEIAFGDQQLPVDLYTDLPVLLEQLPSALDAIHQKDNKIVIDLYEQGIEQRIIFTPTESGYKLTRIPRSLDTGQSIDPINEFDLLHVLSSCGREFLSFAFDVAPTLKSHPWVIEWSDPVN